MFEEISFPEHEYESIQNYLNKLGHCYTTRVYKEIGKYKVGELYTAPWGDVLKIDEVKTYWKVSERPFYDEMNDDEKIEIRTYSEDIGLPYEFIKFSKSTAWLYFNSDKLYVSKNYVFYRIEEKYIQIINLYHEKEDFLWQLFGVDTTPQETIDYWNE